MASPRRILLAEDDRFLRKAAEATLRGGGYAVTTAVDGEQALTLARSQAPDAVGWASSSCSRSATTSAR